MKNTNDKINLEKDNDGLLSFGANSDTIYLFRDKIFGAFSKKGINVTVTDEWKKGIFDLFSVELVNAPDFSKENYLLLSNHISDFDAVLLGLLYRDIRIIAKMGWISNPELSKFLEHHYNIVGIYRQVELFNEKEQSTANSHNLKVLTDAMR
ncbi:MAG: hypothetical protein FWC82_03940, partial [Firmicutes bacterium]|nr:hypothetical protein [Bacillota bacterium]